MRKIKKGILGFVLVLCLTASMALPALAKESRNEGIETCAVISSCPVCMSRNISSVKNSVRYEYVGQTRYVIENWFDYCRDCGFRTPLREVRYVG